MREWLRTASIPNDRFLKSDLIGPRLKPDSKGTIFLESKKDMKARGLASPDAADAIAGLLGLPTIAVALVAVVAALQSFLAITGICIACRFYGIYARFARR